MSLMCENPEAAQKNRERVKTGYGNRYYEQQAHAVAQWGLEQSKPESVMLGELPVLDRISNNKIEEDE